MSYKIHTNDNTILHSDIYMGTDFSEGFEHWKYIKRYKGKNGKWQYVYADKKTHKQIAANKKAAKDASLRSKYYNNLSTQHRISRDTKRMMGRRYDEDPNIEFGKRKSESEKRASRLYDDTAKKLIDKNDIVKKGKKFLQKIGKKQKIKKSIGANKATKKTGFSVGGNSGIYKTKSKSQLHKDVEDNKIYIDDEYQKERKYNSKKNKW